MYYIITMIYLNNGVLKEESTDALSYASEIYASIAAWLNLSGQEFKLIFSQSSSLNLTGLADVLVDDDSLATCKPPGESSCIYLKIITREELLPRYRNRYFKLELSRYKY
ncbi:hypothetical protein GGH95_005139 [Coemansia sp. RSA 1836]|nr:hypothetical protein GGI00_002063 [Coemansia sp. RSA 2681]KAJ2453756.1 hypothetical protein GGF42_003751 [Coemansia sp. RSA 2424]KAJ2557564.1 hypothetical protein GGH95_005139 [Coemansia sp. RSA 1836]